MICHVPSEIYISHPIMQSSLERINPHDKGQHEVAGTETLELHLERYRFAAQHLVPGVIADMACGVGYGSHLLATNFGESVEKILAVDLSHDAIDYGRTHFKHALISYYQADIYHFVPEYPIDTLLTLETLEHLENPKKFLEHMLQFMPKGSRVIASAPVTPSMDANPFHLQDFTVKSFKAMFLELGLREVNTMMQIQPYKLHMVANRTDARASDLRDNLTAYYLHHPDKLWLRIKSACLDGFVNKYFVAVWEV
jgi:2-polyprenyl-3-methyl-5-hydroxy-6-metoxy-1,4-benzoquinol methylase